MQNSHNHLILFIVYQNHFNVLLNYYFIMNRQWWYKHSPKLYLKMQRGLFSDDPKGSGIRLLNKYMDFYIMATFYELIFKISSCLWRFFLNKRD